jgi:hypothetical protein
MTIAQEWLNAKEAETTAINHRRKLEEDMIKLFNVPEDLAVTKNYMDGDFEVKITGSITRKVDSDKLQEIAAEAGLTEHLSTLFRWKPEIIAAAWDAADSKIKTPLLAAVTSKAAKPTFKISKKEL